MLEGVDLILIHSILEVGEEELDINPGCGAWAEWITTSEMEYSQTINRNMGKILILLWAC